MNRTSPRPPPPTYPPPATLTDEDVSPGVTVAMTTTTTQHRAHRAKHRVILRIYDLSHGRIAKLSTFFMKRPIRGIWHTAIEAYGFEYFYGDSICKLPSEVVERELKMAPVDVKYLGETSISQAEFECYLNNIRGRFTREEYRLLEWNCNHFSNACCRFLLGGKEIPREILDLPQMVEESVVGKMALMWYRNGHPAVNTNQSNQTNQIGPHLRSQSVRRPKGLSAAPRRVATSRNNHFGNSAEDDDISMIAHSSRRLAPRQPRLTERLNRISNGPNRGTIQTYRSVSPVPSARMMPPPSGVQTDRHSLDRPIPFDTSANRASGFDKSLIGFDPPVLERQNLEDHPFIKKAMEGNEKPPGFNVIIDKAADGIAIEKPSDGRYFSDRTHSVDPLPSLPIPSTEYPRAFSYATFEAPPLRQTLHRSLEPPTQNPMNRGSIGASRGGEVPNQLVPSAQPSPLLLRSSTRAVAPSLTHTRIPTRSVPAKLDRSSIQTHNLPLSKPPRLRVLATAAPAPTVRLPPPALIEILRPSPLAAGCRPKLLSGFRPNPEPPTRHVVS
eukprot:Protomagalhaensia_sp_Gyna_25__4712@NODE_456_length_3386_cov_316_591276_g351_i0_p1_GENE_NODE_456_length_3386_cov_316_591276_g351_i0NODE_456_length_3386_cov_316_591276_g351_i0_p1_ORF_typecomplete_len556_score70_06Peptidase_C97/PF05903_14/8_9e29LRAT/PF04970_13/0_32_NODE_456_length_3386_cov_316_591276_g351_i013683035